MIHGDAVRNMMISASDLGYTTGDHVYIGFELFENKFWGKVDPIRSDIYDEVAIKAFKTLLLISFDDDHDAFGKEFDTEIKIIAKKKYNYTFNPLERLDPIVVGHYEGISVYAHAIQSLLTDGLDVTNGRLVVSRIVNSAYEGFRGAPMWVNSNRQRDKDYNIKMYDRLLQGFEVFIQYRPHSANNVTFRPIKNITWPNGILPPDEPQCGFRADKCLDDGLPPAILAVAIVVPLVFVFLVGIGGSFLFYNVWKIKGSFNPDWWRIRIDELELKIGTVGGASKRSLQSQATVKTSPSAYTPANTSEIIATYKGETVALVEVAELMRVANNDLVDELNLIKPIENNNLQRVFGVGVDPHNTCHYIVCEACPKGSLTDILENEMIKLDWYFKNSLIRDVVHGMAYLHSSHVVSHGNLTSDTCFIDVRFTLKISDYGLPFFRVKDFFEPVKLSDKERPLTPLLWRAPELLRQVMPAKGTQRGDVYSFAIVLQQIILRSGPFELPGDPLEMSEKEILMEVIADNIPPTRPRVPRSACSNELYDLMERCWEEVPLERPAFARTKERLRKIVGNIGDNLVDLLLKRMEQYASDLEQKVADQTQQFMDEKIRSEQLLSQLLPKSIAAALTKGIQVYPESFENVTIFFSDIVGFTTISAKGSPMDVVDLLNGLYTFFDGVLEKYDVYKVETIGDAYMVASGLPVRNGSRHASQIASMAIELQANIVHFVVPKNPEEKVKIRAGINSGPCVAGIVGLKMPRYCVFGDTVNTASRMESTGEPGRIQITQVTKQLLESHGGFLTVERGEISVKGKGNMSTHWLLRT